MSSSAPEPEVVAAYGRAALQNARDLISDSEGLLSLQRWPRACSLAVLAIEEGSKAITCTIMPLLPPEQARELFAWPFAEINRTHGLRLGMAAVVSHIIGFFVGGPGSPQRYAPTEMATLASAKSDNELKQRGFYVTYRDDQIQRPADVTETEAKAVLSWARMLANVSEDILAWSENLPAELLAARGAQWDAMVAAFQQGGFEAMGEVSESMFERLPDEAVAQIRQGLLTLTAGSASEPAFGESPPAEGS